MAPSDAPIGPSISFTCGTSVSDVDSSSADASHSIVDGHGDLEETMARMPALMADGTTRGKSGDVTGHEAG
jgi:hypothetical protein